jgi:RecA/RadA recombinase
MAKTDNKGKTENPYLKLRANLKKLEGVSISSKGKKIERADTGSKAMNLVLGGGYPRGHITEFFGKPGAGKTTMCLYAMRQALLRGERVFYLKGEKRVDFSWWAKLGLPMELINGEWVCTLEDQYGPMIDILDAGTAETAMQSWLWMLESDLYGVGVFDGITALATLAESNTDFSKESRVGGISKLLARVFRVLGTIIENTNCAVLLTNQVRDNIGDTWNPLTTPGGWSLKHVQSLQIQMFDTKEVWADDTREVLTAIIWRWYMRKTSVVDFVAGLQEVMMTREVATGNMEIDPIQEVFEIAKKLDIFTTTGGKPYKNKGNCYYAINTEELGADYLLGNGKDNIIKFLRETPHVFDALEREVDDKILNKAKSVPEVEQDEDLMLQVQAQLIEIEEDDEES